MRKSGRKNEKIEQKLPVQDAQETGFELRNLIPLLILFVVPFLLYASSISFDYVLDDKIVLTENNFVKKGIAGVKEIFTTESFTGYLGSQQDLIVGARYRPLSIAMFAIEYEFFGFNPKISHFLNLLFYSLTGLMLFILLSLLLPSVKERKWYFGVPFIASLLFILHPLHTEVVANIKSRDEILALLLALVALYFLYRYTVSNNKLSLIASALVFFLALMAKESTLPFVVIIPVTLYFFTKADSKKILTATSVVLISTIIYIGIRYQVIGYLLDSGREVTGLMNNPFLGASTEDKYATIFYTLGLYLKLLIFPHPLTHDYYPYHIPIMDWTSIKVILSFAAYLFMGIYAVINFKEKKIIVWSIIFYLGTLSIVSNLFFSIGTFMNERFLYIPSLGFVVFLSFFIIERMPILFRKIPKIATALSFGLLAIFILGFTYKTIDRTPAWKNEMALNRAASKVSVNSARANQYMAYSLYRAALEMKDRVAQLKNYDEATYYVDRALEIYPTYTEALTCKAGVLAGYYQLDGNIEKLLDGFYNIQMSHPVPFVDTYLSYLDKRVNRQTMSAFYQKLGTGLKQKRNVNKANYYLNKVGK